MKRDIVAGNRVKISEAPEVLIEQHAGCGESCNITFTRKGEKIFQEYDNKLEEVSYDSCMY